MVRLKIKLVFDFIVLKRGGQLLRDNYNLNTAASIVKFTFSIYHLARVCFLFFISCQKRGRAIGVGLQEENSLWFDWQQSSAILLTACVVCVCVCVCVYLSVCVLLCASLLEGNAKLKLQASFFKDLHELVPYSPFTSSPFFLVNGSHFR